MGSFGNRNKIEIPMTLSSILMIYAVSIGSSLLLIGKASSVWNRREMEETKDLQS
jgi:hypothetical protein